MDAQDVAILSDVPTPACKKEQPRVAIWHDPAWTRSITVKNNVYPVRGRTIAVVWDGLQRHIGIAECSVNDAFDKKFGWRLAFNRAMFNFNNLNWGPYNNSPWTEPTVAEARHRWEEFKRANTAREQRFTVLVKGNGTMSLWTTPRHCSAMKSPTMFSTPIMLTIPRWMLFDTSELRGVET